MPKDSFDKISLFLLALLVVALLVLLGLSGGSPGKKGAGLDKAAAREMAQQARVELIGKLYGPVEALRKSGNPQMALLKLDELIRKYPGEAHGHILLGEILLDSGTIDEAVGSFVEGVKLNGDYLDAKSPLSRRAEIRHLVEEGLKSIGASSAAHPGNRTLAATLQQVNYLKSRLAGGCE